MAETLKIRSATLVHDGTTYEFTQGPIPDDTPKAVVDKLRADGSLATAADEAVAGAALDPATAGTDDLAEYIDANSLTAEETVALARDDPALAQKVIDAENLAHGGDGRKTVIVPLEKLRG